MCDNEEGDLHLQSTHTKQICPTKKEQNTTCKNSLRAKRRHVGIAFKSKTTGKEFIDTTRPLQPSES